MPDHVYVHSVDDLTVNLMKIKQQLQIDATTVFLQVTNAFFCLLYLNLFQQASLELFQQEGRRTNHTT